MFCTKCGKQVPDGLPFCESCGAPMKDRPDAAPMEPETPEMVKDPVMEAAEDISISLNTGDGPRKPKRKKGGPLSFVIPAVAAVLAVVLVIFNASAIKGFFNRTFLSAEDYQKTVQKEALCDAVTTGYGEYLEALSESSNAGSAQIHLKVGDDLLTLLESSSGVEDLSFLSDIMMNVTAIQEEGLTQMDLGFGLKNTEIVAARVILDMIDPEDGAIYMGLPGLSSEYLVAELENMTEVAMTAPSFSQDDLRKLLPDEKTVNDLMERYSDMILSKIENVEKDSKTVSCNGAEQKVTALTTTITAEEMVEILVSVFESMEKDEDIRAILENAEDVLEDAGVEAEDLYNGFRAGLDAAIESLEEADADDSDITVVTYVDYEDHIVGRDVTVTVEDEEMEILQYLSLTDGSKTGFSLIVPEADIEIEGEGTKKGDKHNAVYSLSVQDMDIGKLELEDVVNTEDELSGVFRLRPSSELIETVLEDSGLPVSIISDSIALTFEVQCTKETAEMAIRLVTGGTDLISLEISGQELADEEISIPSDAIDATDEEAMMEFLQSVDVDKLMSKLEEAGLSEELLEGLFYSLYYGGDYYDYNY